MKRVKIHVPDDAKMKELILYVAEACEKDEKFGAIKLNKILFYADFLSYLRRGKSITGQEYFALDEGPAPKRFVPIREQMVKAREIAVQSRDYFGHPQTRVLALNHPVVLKRLDQADIAIVNQVIGALKDKGAKEVSEQSHKFAGWRVAYSKGSKTRMRYSMALFDTKGLWNIDSPSLPPALVEYGKRLHRKLGLVAA
jgi:uncharacterized phage-associated protein